jgi:hypothetical protein
MCAWNTGLMGQEQAQAVAAEQHEEATTVKEPVTSAAMDVDVASGEY